MGSDRTERDHGGNLEAAMARFGGCARDWLDLSTGINPLAYPVPALSPEAFEVLPRRDAFNRLIDAARHAYRTDLEVVPMSGAQGAIQAVPRLALPGRAAVLSPTYNEHTAALRFAGWQVSEAGEVEGLRDADLAVVVNPNNPTGARVSPDALCELAGAVGLLVIDESFCDSEAELSIAQRGRGVPANIIVLRSFGKFYGLAGLRLGFALAAPGIASRLREIAGPWPVSGPALEIGTVALRDETWRASTVRRLRADVERLDRLAETSGWAFVGGTALFRTYETPSAQQAQKRLAEGRVWSRVFPYSATWIRLGLPHPDRWNQLGRAFQNGQSPV